MWQTAHLAVASIFFAAVLGNIVDDPVEAHLKRELWKLKHEVHHHRHHHHGLQHRPRRFLGLIGHSHLAPGVGEGQVLAGRTAAVAGKLQRMGKELHELHDRRHAASNAHSNLEGEVKEAIHHMNSMAEIKSQFAQTEARIHSEERKLRRLEDDRLHLDRARESLSLSLHHTLEPKIKHAEAHLDKVRHVAHETEVKAAEWHRKEEQLHKAALEMLEQRDKSKEDLEVALVAEDKAHRERLAVEKRFGAMKRSAGMKIEGYKFSQAEEKAAASKEVRAKEEQQQAEYSLKRLSFIYNAEQRQVDKSMAAGKARVQHKMQQLEKAKQENRAKLTSLQHQYAEWVAGQQSWANHLAAMRQSTNDASQHYVDAQESMLTSARDQVVLDAEQDSVDPETSSDWAWDAE